MKKLAIFLLSWNTRHIGQAKRLNFDLDKVEESKKLQLDELEEIKNDAYDCSKWYKGRMKMMLVRVIIQKDFQSRQKVLLYNSRLHFFSKKLKSHWIDPYIVHNVHPHGAVEIHNAMMVPLFK